MIFEEQTRTQCITKEQVWAAWNYLYPLWVRLASGSYFPPAVREKAIPKSKHKVRYLGIPTICDRVAQQVIRAELEPILEPKFSKNSFGSRPGKSAHQALEQCAKHCWERWLKAPVKHTDGSYSEPRGKGTCQGGVISPLLANLYLHEAFDSWMETEHGVMRYERYMDDIVIHTRSIEQSDFIYDRLKQRLCEYRLELNEEKTHNVYCYRTARFHKESKNVPVSFDFLGYTFKPRLCGWLHYYGHFRLSEMQPLFSDLNYRLVRWVQQKYKYTSYRKAKRWLQHKMECFPHLFEHWKYGFTT